MLTVEEATRKILPFARTMKGAEHVPLMQAVGRVLMHDVIASRDVPSCDNSAMDGYAVRSSDVVGSISLPLVGTVYAGDAVEALPPHSALRIFTGAPMPMGADAVVIQEDADSNGEFVILQNAVKPGANVRRQGEDIESGELLFPQGHCLRPQDIGLLASLGLPDVMVFERLRVGLLSTGDELLEPGEMAVEGRVYNSNRYLLATLLQTMGCDVVDAGRVPDELAATEAALEALADTADILLTTGGVSVGEADYVKAAVLALGDLSVWKIALKPGKPLAFGSVKGKPFFGLPGNPVSAYVTFLLFVRPFLQVEQGGQPRPLRRIPVRAAFDWPKAGKREEYLRIKLQVGDDGLLHAICFPNQGSGVLSSVCWADGLLRVPAGHTFAVGDWVECMLLDSLLHG